MLSYSCPCAASEPFDRWTPQIGPVRAEDVLFDEMFHRGCVVHRTAEEAESKLLGRGRIAKHSRSSASESARHWCRLL